jgi:hypothetical protein
MGSLLGITTLWTRNPQEEADSFRNYQVIEEESIQGREIHWELPDFLHRFRPARSNCTENPLSGYNSRISISKTDALTMPTLRI